MSRDAFSHDPQDTREPSPPRSVRRHRPPPSGPRDEGDYEKRDERSRGARRPS